MKMLMLSLYTFTWSTP